MTLIHTVFKDNRTSQITQMSMDLENFRGFFFTFQDPPVVDLYSFSRYLGRTKSDCLVFLFCVSRVIGRDGKLEPGGELVAPGGNGALRTAQNSLGLGFHGGFGVQGSCTPAHVRQRVKAEQDEGSQRAVVAH